MARSEDPAARDAPGRGGARSVRESVALVAIGVVLLGVAAWSASRASLGGESPDLSGSVRGNEAALNDALLVAVGALVAAVVILVAPALLRQRRGPAMAGDDETPRPRFWLRIVVGVLVMFAVVLAIMLAARNRPDQTQPLLVAPAPREEVRPQPGTRAGAHGWSAAALAAAGAIAVVTALVVWRRRGRVRGPMSEVDVRPLPSPAEPVDFDALAPADAIRAAYAAARHALAPMGVPSRPPETPYEYLDRVRTVAPSFERPLATLTRLFEVARFSHHPVTPAMKADAIAAYDMVAGEVARLRDAAVLA
jgi:hypothetical protein